MSNNTELNKDEIKASNPDINQIDKENKENLAPEKVNEKKKKKHVSALVAASMGRSVLDHVKAHSSGNVSGSSGLENTGPDVSYEEES
ncbi:MAG: hypothetical protein M3R50_02825 [Bacteroidota bacterium]|nr:hypothetical protein [Bacteroidota bacterium]